MVFLAVCLMFLPKDSAKANPKNGAVKRAKNTCRKEDNHA